MKIGVPAALLLMTLNVSAQKTITEGWQDSPVRVIIYEDLACSDCAVFRRMMDEKLLPAYAAEVAFIHCDFPLAKHAWARPAAIAARFFATHDAALALEYRRYCFAGQPVTDENNFKRRLIAFAQAHGIDAGAASAALENPQYAAMVEADYQDGVARGVVHTPAVFVNGHPFIETFSFAEISKAINEALAQAK